MDPRVQVAGWAGGCLAARTACWDPVCTIDEVWCSSEHYLWLKVAFAVGQWIRTAPYVAIVRYLLKLVDLVNLAVG